MLFILSKFSISFIKHSSFTRHFCLLFIFLSIKGNNFSYVSEPYVADLVHGRSTINNPKTINSSSWNILHTHSEISWRGGPKPS
ncbi:hypothetical protein Hanom_Chr10g00873531 [Helianthus anomalus]